MHFFNATPETIPLFWAAIRALLEIMKKKIIMKPGTCFSFGILLNLQT